MKRNIVSASHKTFHHKQVIVDVKQMSSKVSK